MAEFAINSYVSKTIKVSLFFANKGYYLYIDFDFQLKTKKPCIIKKKYN